ncbi:MAG: glycosyltransferase family 2 protein [Hyphomicrobiaceae bacterium]
MAPTVSILIVSYNTREMTLACLDSIAAETSCASYEIIVVDNASTDGSIEAIAAHPSRPTLLPMRSNVGFGRANNLAAEMAAGEFLLLLNPDTVVLDGAVDRLVAFARERPEAMIWGGRTLFADGRLNPASAWGRMTPWRLFCRASGLTSVASASSLLNGEGMGAWPRDSERAVDIVSGCFLLISSAFWRRLGGFDPAYFMYGEEADLCLRARALGARPRITPAATIVHHGGASETIREDKMVRLLAAKATLIDRHFPSSTRGLGLALNAAWPLSRWLILALAARMAGSRSVAERATIWQRIWQRRREWQDGWARPARRPEPDAAGRSPTIAPQA